LQLAGSFGDKFSYILGGYVGREKGYELSYSQTFGFLPLARFITDNDADILNKTQGVFVQGYYKFTDKLRLTAGYRYTWDQRQAILHNQSVLGEPSTCTVTKDPGQTACSQTLNAQFSYPAYTVGVDYQATRNIFVYAKTSAAAKAGGWNTRFGGIPAFQPEKVKDVEIGAKADWFDRHLRTNIALFDSWTKGPQRNLSTVINFQPTQYIVNAGKLSIWGAEFEATVVPWTGMEVSGNLSLMDGRYKKGSFTETQIVNGVPVIVDRSGENLPQLPKSQFSLGATQHLPVSFGEVSLHADYSFIGSLDIQPVTAAPNASAATKAAYALQNELGHIPSYGLLAARVGVTLKDGGLELYLFGRNLTAKKYISRVFPDLYTQGLGFAEAVVGNPRTFGIGANIKFGR
jgi:iron complex outermembrane receptor protein